MQNCRHIFLPNFVALRVAVSSECSRHTNPNFFIIIDYFNEWIHVIYFHTICPLFGEFPLFRGRYSRGISVYSCWELRKYLLNKRARYRSFTASIYIYIYKFDFLILCSYFFKLPYIFSFKNLNTVKFLFTECPFNWFS